MISKFPPYPNNCYAAAPLPAPDVQQAFVPIFWPIRWCFYLFIFFIVAENAIAIRYFAITKLLGVILVALAFLQPFLLFHRPPKAFWCFFIYFSIHAIRTACSDVIHDDSIRSITTNFQCLLLFLLAYNLILLGGLGKSVFVAFALSCSLAAFASYAGFGAVATGDDSLRESAMGQNPNALAMLYSIGLLSTIALLAEKTTSFLWRATAIPLMLVFAYKCVATGSRGGTLMAFIGALVYFLSAKGVKGKVKGMVVGGVVIAALGYSFLHSEITYNRWMMTVDKGMEGTAGRDKIFSDAWNLFLAEPLFGWGAENRVVLARRSNYGGGIRDTHNDLLYALTSTGVFGTVFFVWGVLSCINQAWKGRRGPAGSVPLALVFGICIMSLGGTLQTNKAVWTSLAIACASGGMVAAASRTQQRPALDFNSSVL